MSTSSDGLPGASRVGRVALTANDLDRVVPFYRDVVGLEVLRRGRDEARLGVDGTELLVLGRDESAPARPETSAGLYHLAVRVPDRTSLGAALERIESDWRLDGASDHAVSEALYLRDPEDNGVEVYRDREREAWPLAADGSVEMGTEPLDLPSLRSASDGSTAYPPGTTIGHVHLEVTRLEAARRFYVDGLGLTVRQSFPGSALFLAAGQYHHHVGLNTWRRRTDPVDGRGLEWFEVVVPDRDAVARARDRLRSNGAEPTPVDGDPDSGFRVDDPDGIGLRVRRGDPPADT